MLRKTVVISFIIPAHNEEALIGRTLAAIRGATEKLSETYEIIVASDASTDRTSAIAREHQARVIEVDHRQISATRNAGAKEARGDVFIFVDADTVVTLAVLQAALKALRRGAVGGGCLVRIDGQVPAYGVVLERILLTLAPVVGLAGGCFFFCTRRAFDRAGGFDETLFVSEEVTLARRLKRQGRFVILRDRVVTSGRKLRTHSAFDMLRIGLRLTLGGYGATRKREGLELWYGPRGV